MSNKYYRTQGEWEQFWDYLHIHDASCQGYVPYFGPCSTHNEGWMIHRVVNDILRNGRDRYCIVKYPGNLIEVWIIPNYNQGHRAPWIYMPPEDDEE
jgi:hypothetical protein